MPRLPWDIRPASTCDCSHRLAAPGGTQSDATYSALLILAGSLVFTVIWNRCLPAMPSCIINSVDSLVLSPGRKVVVPTTALGGQHPSNTRTGEEASSCSVR